MDGNEEKKPTGEAPPAATARWVGGAALDALLASVCCLGPLVLTVVGLSAAGVAAAFEPLRPLFLGATALLLASAFYAAYFRRSACDREERARLARTRAALWIAAGVVALIALFPVYGGALLRAGAAPDAGVGVARGGVVELAIEGMTCESCAVGLQHTLGRVPGVVSAEVRYSEGRALIGTDPTAAVPAQSLVRAVEKAGYQAHIRTGGR